MAGHPISGAGIVSFFIAHLGYLRYALVNVSTAGAGILLTGFGTY
jgi:hypothetical protein